MYGTSWPYEYRSRYTTSWSRVPAIFTLDNNTILPIIIDFRAPIAQLSIMSSLASAYYPCQLAWKRFLAAMMAPAASSIKTYSDITATGLLQHVAAIAAIAMARIYITSQLTRQQGIAPSWDTFEMSLVIDAVAVVATACCGFLMHARLQGTLLAALHHEFATNNDDATAGTITLKPAIISSLSYAERAYEPEMPGDLKQKRRGRDTSVVFADGKADEGDDDGSILTSTDNARAATIKQRIAQLRERKCNVPAGDHAADNPLSESKLDTLKLSRPSPPAATMRGSGPPSGAEIGLVKKSFYDDSARECMLDVEPAWVVNTGSMPPIPAEAVSMSQDSSIISDDDDTWLPSSEPSSQPPRKAAETDEVVEDAGVMRSPLRKAVLDLLPGSLPSINYSRMSRPLLNSHCGTFLSTLDKNGFWQSLSNRKQEAKSCNRPNIIEIMSVGGDDPVSQRILAKILVTGYGFGFSLVDSGEGALEELKGRYNEGGKESLPTLILMDTALPDNNMDGYETTKKIRSLFPDVALPIIMLTASSDLEITTFQRAVEAGADDLVTQPITKHNLMARIGCQLKSLHFWRGQLESRQSEFLLNEILPKNIITKLKQGHTGCIYDELEEVSVIFTDIVSFTSLSASHPTEEIIHMLDLLFTEFDKLTDKHGLYKVETIGEKALPDRY